MANSVTHTYGVSVRTATGQITSTTDAFTADSELVYEGSLATATTNQILTFAFPFAKVVSAVLYSTKALTIKTNSTGSPDDTIVLTALKQKNYNTDMATAARLFTVNVTALYLTNASGATADIKIHILFDGTT